jgi:hypothetical protein
VRDGTALRFVTVPVNQGGCRSWRETNVRAIFQRVTGLVRRSDHAGSNELVELAGPALPASSRRNKLRHNPPVRSYYDTLPRLDSPNVPAEVVLQFAYAYVHVLTVATCSHAVKGRGA